MAASARQELRPLPTEENPTVQPLKGPFKDSVGPSVQTHISPLLDQRIKLSLASELNLALVLLAQTLGMRTLLGPD